MYQVSLEEQSNRGLEEPFIREVIVKPYIMDLESTNKTILNGEVIEDARYYELREEDVI